MSDDIHSMVVLRVGDYVQIVPEGNMFGRITEITADGWYWVQGGADDDEVYRATRTELKRVAGV